MSPDEIAPFRSRGERPIVWFRHGREHSNHCCPYCGRLVGPDSPVASDKEHLVARKFVPSGRLAGNAFNFIFHARRDCNGEKAGAERHISTVTLLRSPDGIYRPSGSLLRSAADSDARYIGTELSLMQRGRQPRIFRRPRSTRISSLAASSRRLVPRITSTSSSSLLSCYSKALSRAPRHMTKRYLSRDLHHRDNPLMRKQSD